MISPRRKLYALTVAALFFVSAFGASASLLDVLPEMGDLQRWAVFTLGAGGDDDLLSQNAFVQGDVGVAGNGNITMSGQATIQGDLYYRSNGTLTMSPNASVTGAQIHDQDSQLDNGVTEARSASRHAADLARTWFLATNVQLDNNKSISVAGAPGETVVVKLGNFELSGNATFTLQGSATTTFIINVRKQFSLSGHAQIVLAGGVEWNNVLFNVRGKEGPISLSGDSHFQGILMANGRTVHLNDSSTVTGEVIANRVVFNRLTGGSSVIHPVLASP
jgi:cytoskeletal protein CcmA (bactofilin family)